MSNGGCDTQAICNNTEGSFTCTCQPGYTGNGITCSGEQIFARVYVGFTFHLPVAYAANNTRSLILGNVTIGSTRYVTFVLCLVMSVVCNFCQ